MSARWSTAAASRHCSGAMYAGVPRAIRAPVMSGGRVCNPLSLPRLSASTSARRSMSGVFTRPRSATFTVPCTSPNLVESKSLKLYLNSLNAERFNSEEAVRERIAFDLSARAGADVAVAFGLPPMAESEAGESIDLLDIDIDDYGPPNPGHLSADPAQVVEESLSSQLLKSNCPVTGQPDWASVVLSYRGPRLDRAGLLRYLVSFRDHAGFHEQCVEQIFHDILTRCRPQALSVEARYTRRGGLDINPWRATGNFPAPAPARETRQ